MTTPAARSTLFSASRPRAMAAIYWMLGRISNKSGLRRAMTPEKIYLWLRVSSCHTPGERTGVSHCSIPVGLTAHECHNYGIFNRRSYKALCPRWRNVAARLGEVMDLARIIQTGLLGWEIVFLASVQRRNLWFCT